LTFVSLAALVIVLCLLAFYSVNIANVFVGSRHRRGIERRAEVPPPSERNIMFLLVGVSTFSLFALSVLYVLLAWLGLETAFPLSLTQLPHSAVLQLGGLAIFAVGFGLFIWSVLARGRYSVSWAMPVDHKLITSGPYGYIRHPSYTGYFFMFVGLFLTWFNLLAAIPLLGIPGYVRIAKREEEMLELRFGNAYAEYQRKTGRFLPRL
jgi:protein-S-isoprenylcysteine O-methyltransferase Ste14